MILWTICGTGRGVGKTHLASALCKALPNAVYAKLGCGRSKAEKPENFFHSEDDLARFVEEHRSSNDHIVVEANAWARQSKGDVIIFLGGVPERKDVREDADVLESHSHIRVIAGASVRDWKRVLNARLSDDAICRKVCELLTRQKSFLLGPSLSVRSKVWFVAGDQHAFGSGLADLLDKIEHLGSLTEAARVLNISYRRAWDLIKDAEKHLGKKLTISESGGIGGGGSALSSDGRRLLDTYRRVNREVAEYADARFSIHLNGENADE